jgi:hypothetical protein
MKPNVTYIDGEKLMALVRESGSPTKEQSGNFRVESKTCPGCRLYVPRGKRVCRVDLSGFTVSDPAVRDLGGESFGNVKQQIDFSLPEDGVLAGFKRVLDHLNSIPPGASPVRPRTEKQKKFRQPGSEPSAAAEEPAGSQAKGPADERRERIMARAQQLMVTVPGMAVGAAVLQAQQEFAAAAAVAAAKEEPTSPSVQAEASAEETDQTVEEEAAGAIEESVEEAGAAQGEVG